MGKGTGSWAMGMQSVLWHGVCSKLYGGGGLVGTSPLTFTFWIFWVKVDSKVMGHL